MYNLFTEFKSDPKPEKGADGKEIKKKYSTNHEC